MTRKVTLSIPDLLHEKLEDWRKSFNLSKMFQDALADAIQKKEDFQRRLQDDLTMSETIERLRQEKKISEGNYSENGRKEGFRWAKSAHYDDLMHALDLDSAAAMAQDERLAACFNNTLEQENFTAQSGSELTKYKKLFLEGWLQGVNEFWNEIKEKL